MDTLLCRGRAGRVPVTYVHGSYGMGYQPQAVPWPGVRAPGGPTTAAGTTASGHEDAAAGSGDASGDARSRVSTIALQASFAAGIAKQGLDMGRVAVKLPEAHQTGRLGTALRQAITASPTTTIIDPTAPPVATAASGWRSFTRLDAKAYRSSMLLGAGLSVLQVGSALPNLIEAARDDGAGGLLESRAGRSGVLQASFGALALGMLGRASLQARAAGTRGLVPTVLEASLSPSLSRPWTAALPIVGGGLVVANEAGFLDRMNAGETRSRRETFDDAVRSLPVVGSRIDAASAQGRDTPVRPPVGAAPVERADITER